AIPGVLVCIIAAPVVYFMWPWFSVSDSILPEWLARYGLRGWAWLLLIPYFSLVHPVLEEVHWRGISQDSTTGICWQDLLFAGYHVLVLFQLIRWPWLFLVFGVLAGSSVFWRWATSRSGGYGLSILTHAAADAAVVAGIHFLLRG
ncbi:MAG: CPBP family intramembrane metalloprotease, partial [Verrucomicrobia bacterium]|nr:CPBP family intramembrane metalloprotease [Verrucomicrobiota bacterium]